MKIGIVGSGNVGGALGVRWAAAGHAVAFGSRTPSSDEMRALVDRAGTQARGMTTEEAAAFGDLVLLATPWPATRQIVEGITQWQGKVLIDATNPLLPNLSGLEFGTTTSGAEQVATWAPGSTVVKAFNTVGFNVMENPDFAGSKAAMFYCGDDQKAKEQVRQLIAELGFDPHDAGALRQARLLEPFATLWITMAITRGYGREFAFQLIRR